MEEDGGAMVQPNNSFARKLGSADKKTRDRGVALLVLWLSGQQDVTEDELKKIWKGLFYCMWHSDKALVQADLISKLAGILESLDVDLALTFFKVFLTTMRREWGGIDRLRLDKFYLLLRQFLVKVFVVLEKTKWDEEVVGKFMDALVERALLASDEYPALGVNLHLMDIFLSELRKFQPLSSGTLRLMLQPCYATLASAVDKTLMRRVKEAVFEPLLEEAQTFLKNKQGGVAVEENSFGPHVISLPISARLFELASSESTPQANRKLLYDVYSEYAKLDKLVSITGVDLTTLRTGGGSNTDTEMVEVGSNGGVTNLSRKTGRRDKGEQVVTVNAVEGKKRKAKDVTAASKKSKDSPVLKDPKPKDKVKEPESKKRTKKGTVKPQDKMDYREHLPPVKVEESRKGTGAKLSDMLEDETLAAGVIVEKKKKPNKKVSTDIAQSHALKQKKAKRNVEVEKSSLVQAVQTGGTVEVLEVNLVVTEVVGVANASDGEQLQSRAVNSPTVEVTGGTEELSGKRDAESLMDVSVDDSVIANLEEKFASIAAQVAPEASSNDLSSEDSPLKVIGKKKRKRGSNVEESAPSSGKTPSTGQSPTPSLKSNGVDQTPLSNASKKKKVKFVLKNNIVWKPHNPLPPKSLRTPPSATPRGSALKQGVPAGPIRVSPARKGLGSTSKGRSPSLALSMSKQKPSRSPKSLVKGAKFGRRVRKSPGFL